MGDEITFRTSVGGYRRDEVLEYVENTNEKIFQMKKEQEEETRTYQARIQELEAILSGKQQEDQESIKALEREKKALQEENERQKEEIRNLEEKWKLAYQDYTKAEAEKSVLKDKLAREILRLRAENKDLWEKWKEAEANVGTKGDYQAVRNTVSEVQYKIAEYVNIINKTQQSLADTYQEMNGLKKKISAQMAKEEKGK